MPTPRRLTAEDLSDIREYVSYEPEMNLFITGDIEQFGLRDRARETVEDESVGALGGGEACGNHVGDDLVGDELALVHEGLGLLAKLALSLDGSAQQVASRDVSHAVVSDELLSLSALASAGSTKENEIHSEPPFE